MFLYNLNPQGLISHNIIPPNKCAIPYQNQLRNHFNKERQIISLLWIKIAFHLNKKGSDS